MNKTESDTQINTKSMDSIELMLKMFFRCFNHGI